MSKLLSYLSVLIVLFTYACSNDEEGNPCGKLNCKNDGICINGTCDCPPHYTGADCGTQITPVQISLTKIEVKQWPQQTPDGEDWDEGWCIGSLPDLFVTLDDGNGVFLQTSFVKEAQPDSVYTYTDSLPVFTPNVNGKINLTLYDRDTGACVPSDSMGTVNTLLYHPDNDFPATFRLNDPAKEIDATLYIEYVF